MPPFTDEQKALIRETARIIWDELRQDHIETCPWGLKLRRMKWTAIGIGLGLVFMGGAGGIGIAKLLHLIP